MAMLLQITRECVKAAGARQSSVEEEVESHGREWKGNDLFRNRMISSYTVGLLSLLPRREDLGRLHERTCPDGYSSEAKDR
jgi:hypothetical protein